MGFEEVDARVLGISLDSVKDQKVFHEKQKLNFALLSDPDGSAAHSAVVARVNPDGINDENDIVLLSKDVKNAIFRHTLGKPGEPNFFRDEFAGGGLKFYRRS